MRHLHALLIAGPLSIVVPTLILAAQPAEDRPDSEASHKWIQLFDGESLDGLYVFLQRHQKNEDPEKIVQVHDGVIHVYRDQPAGSAVPGGYFATETEYAHYHLRLQYKWGEKKFQPRHEQRRDAGVLYHVVGPDRVWPRSVECQIQEGDTGDCFTVMGARLTTNVEMAMIDTPGGPKELPRYLPEDDGGRPQTIGHAGIARVVKASTRERDGWNTVEVIVRGSEEVVHIVNGHIVFRATDLRQLGPNNDWLPLSQGRIAFQAEFAEVFYRNIEIRSLPEGPLRPPADATLQTTSERRQQSAGE